MVQSTVLLTFKSDDILLAFPHGSLLSNSAYEENAKENVIDSYGKSNIWRYKMIQKMIIHRMKQEDKSHS